MVRLGAKTLRSHKLSKASIERAIDCLRRFKQMAEANNVDMIIATATAAVREAHNAEDFIEAVLKDTGLDVEVLPGVEEARLIALAVSEAIDFDNRRALIIDIGGGSTELIVTSGGQPDLLLSLRLGAVRLTEKYITTDPISSKEREMLISNIRTDVVRAIGEVRRVGFDFAVGTSGTVLNLVDAIYRAEEEAVGESIARFAPFSRTVTIDQIHRMNRKLSRMHLKERTRVPGLDKGRADIIIAGGLLLEVLMKEMGAEEITTCDWALREGVVLDYLRKSETAFLPTEEVNHESLISPFNADQSSIDGSTDIRTRSILSVATRYDYDATHSHHVARLATMLFDASKSIHGLGEQERRVLEYAAILHDIGYHIAHNNHHLHSLYLIKNSEMLGFNKTEKALIATIVRYHRGSLPKKRMDRWQQQEHEDYLALSLEERRVAVGLAAILQIADGLDRSYRQKARSLDCQIDKKGMTVKVEFEDDGDPELWSASRKAKWFRQLFRVKVRFRHTKPLQIRTSATTAG